MADEVQNQQPGEAPDPATVAQGALPSPDEYDLGGVNRVEDTPVLEPALPVSLASGEGTPPTPESTTAPESAPPPRDPATGRFIKHDHDRHTVQMAMDLGLTEAEIRKTSPDELSEKVYWMNKSRLDERAFNAQAALMQGASERPAFPPQPAEPDPTIDWGQDDEGNPIKEEAILPGLVNVLKQQQKKIAQLEKLLHADRQERVNQKHFSELERAFAEDKEFFGDGTADDLDRDSVEWERRMHVLDALKRDNGKKYVGSVRQRIKKASGDFKRLLGVAETPKPAPAPVETELEQMSQQWLQGGAARPTSRAPAAEPPGPKKAEATAARFIRDNPALFNGAEQNADGFLE